MRTLRVVFGGAALAVLVAVATGCPNPNNYQTPRTTPEGDVNHVVALEGAYLTNDRNLDVAAPLLPSYHIRYGLADKVDLGGRLLNFSSIGADVKYNFYRSKSFDLAVDPMVQYFNVAGVNGFYLNGALLAGFNVSPTFTVVVTPGFTYAAAVGGNATDAAISAPIGRLSLGLEFKVSQNFSLMPEATAMKVFGPVDGLYAVFGVGFKFGRLPGQDEIQEKARPDGAGGGGSDIYHRGNGGGGARPAGGSDDDIYHRKGGRSNSSQVEQTPIGTRRAGYDTPDGGAPKPDGGK